MGKKSRSKRQNTPSVKVAEGQRLHQLGRFQEAEQLYRKALSSEPDSPETMQLLGILLYQTGRPAHAVELLGKAVLNAPGDAGLLTNLGVAQQLAGDATGALGSFDRALAMEPHDGQIQLARATVLNVIGRHAEALDAADAAFKQDPKSTAALFQRGDALLALGQDQGAVESYRRAVAADPSSFDAQLRLTNLLSRLGLTAEAETSLREALARRPGDPGLTTHLANLLANVGRLPEARALIDAVLKTQPGFTPARAVVSEILRLEKDLPGAIREMREVVRLAPQSIHARGTLARMLNEEGLNDEALAVVAPDPKIPANRSPVLRTLHALLLPAIPRDLEHILQSRDKLVREIATLHAEGVRIEDPLRQVDHTAFFVTYHGLPDRPVQEQIARFYLDASPVLRREPIPRSSAAGRKIRLGLVSATLYKHTTGRLWGRLFGGLPSDELEMVFFRAPSTSDWVTEEVKSASVKTVELANDLKTAQTQILAEKVDFLLYTETAADRLTYYLALCRLAPLQGVMWGHPMTTGSPAMDYFISNEAMETPTSQEAYSERLVALPGLTIAMERPFMPESAGGRARLGLPEDANVYSCPQMPFKLHPDFDNVAFEILRRDPRGRFVLIAVKETWGRLVLERYRQHFPDLADRVIMLPHLEFGDFLTLAQVSDCILTPFPFGAGLSTLDMAGVGVPTVALTGTELKGRITYAVYKKMGMLDLMAESKEQYIELALRMANDTEFSRSMRDKTLKRMESLYGDTSCIADLRRFIVGAVRDSSNA